MTLPIGELAALGAATCWAFTSLLFTFGGRRVGGHVVNLSRLLVAVTILLVIHRGVYGVWIPMGVGLDRWGWLALSGLIGLSLGDALLFQSFIYLGPRLGALLMALSPIIATVAAWLLLDERLGGVDLLAIGLALGGVAWVVAERRPRGPVVAPNSAAAGLTGAGTASESAASTLQAEASADEANRKFGLGVLLGAGAATCQALGLLTSRLGMHGDFPVISATVMRMLAAFAALWLVALLTRTAARPFQTLRHDGRAALAIALAACIGPVTGVSLSLVAVQNAPLGIASTLMALTPVIVLPLVRVLYRERISPRALAGTVIALAGVALIFLA